MSFWLRTNPVSAARHFDHRFQLFVNNVLCGVSKPVGKIVDFKYRIEFQQRGSPHAHMVIWVKEASPITKQTTEQVKKFVEIYVTCALPEDQDDLRSTVETVQMHTHSVACKKSGKQCITVGFPLPAMENTTVYLPIVSSPPESLTKVYEDILHTVQTNVNDIQLNSSVQLRDSLDKLEINMDTYLQAIRWLKTKNGQPAVLIQRKPAENRINIYNANLLSAWKANMDIPFITTDKQLQ